MKNRKQFTNRIASIALLASIPLSSIAQTAAISGSINGHIQNEQQQPVSFAAVTLRNATDSNLVKGALSDSTGNFSFVSISEGNYFLKIQESGAKTAYSKPFKLNQEKPSVNLPAIILSSDATSLKEVKVSAAKPMIEHQAGQTTVNVENSSLSAGNTIMEVLQKSPGVLVDQNDNISLNGKSGVMVMINDRPTHLEGTQLAQFLKNVPAASVSKIELMTQPPAKYSAEGTAGIINIILKKSVATGWNGSLTAGAGYGQYWKYNAGGNLNYRGKKLSIYGNYNFDHHKNKFNMDIDRYFYTPGTETLSSTMSQKSLMEVGGDNHTAQLGLDYDINPKQTIGFVVNGSFNKGDFTSFSPVNFLNASGNIDSISTSNNNNGYNWQNESANLHYNLGLDDKGSALTANLDYNHFYESMPQTMRTTTTDASNETIGNPVNRKGKQPNDINIYAAKLDYSKALKHQFKLEAGIKTSIVKTDNNSEFSILKNSQWQNDAGNTNHFVYNENVNAAYLSLSKTFKKGWSAKAGLRAEQSNIETNQMTLDSINKQNYLDFFPNLSLSKTINPNNMLSISYARRIDRPNYQSLNPFVYYVDEYTYRAGNPYLKPQYLNEVALNYTFKRMYSAELSYSHTSDIISEIASQDNLSKVIYQTQGNISQLDNITLSLSIPVSITKWWQTYNSAQVYYNRYQGLYDGFQLDKGYTSFMVNTYQSFMLPEGWKAELSGMYRSSMIMGPIEVSPMGLVSAGIEKSLWDGKASVKLNVQDIFQTMKFNGKMDFANLHLNSHFRMNDRAANLTFTWNFGNQKVKVRQHKDTSIQSEEKRIQKGAGNAGGM